jgi:hypothetical protein
LDEDVSEEADSESSTSASSSSLEEDEPKKISPRKQKSNSIKNKSPSHIDTQLDEIDELFAAHCSNNQSSTSSISISSNDFNEALSVDPAWLDSNLELKKKFGGSIGGGSSVLGEINSRMLRQNPALSRAVKRKPYKRKNGFITPRPIWPPFGPSDTGLRVELVQKTADFDEYEIIESEEYKAIFEELELLVRTGDLEFLIQLIQTQPLFVDGLLLLSDAYRMQSTGDAGEIVERSLYILERILPTGLDFSHGRCRFRYSHPDNRKLHLCLFRQVQFTMKKGCWRVSLQLAKTLLALDPENDPLGARLFIDFLALQSESFEDFDKLWIQLKRNCPLGHLPGWFFNRALRIYLDEVKEKSDHSSSSEALCEAISYSPGTAKILLQALNSQISDNTLSCESFESDHAQIGAATIFVSRCLSLWKPTNIKKWFESVVASIASKSSESSTSLNFSILPLYYQVSIYRHSLLSDLAQLNIAIPTKVSSISSLNSYDPLPPECFEDTADGRTSIFDGLKNLLLGSLSRGT